jgi:hypothetical protein
VAEVWSHNERPQSHPAAAGPRYTAAEPALGPDDRSRRPGLHPQAGSAAEAQPASFLYTYEGCNASRLLGRRPPQPTGRQAVRVSDP